MATDLDTILFIDLDGTVQNNPFKLHVFPFISKYLSGVTGKTESEIMRDIISENKHRLKSIECNPSLAMDWDDIIKTVAGAYEINSMPSIEDLVVRFSFPPFTEVIDSAVSVLQELRNQDDRGLVVASMGLSKYQFPVMKALGLFDLFQEFLMPDLVGFLKSQSGFYEKYRDYKMVNRINIGDRYDDDVLMPKNFGHFSVLILNIPEISALDPFERPFAIKQFREKIYGLPVDLSEIDILPDAIIVHLKELNDVVKRIENY